MNSPLTLKPNNHTRHNPDLVGKFRAAFRYDLVALYHLLQLSDFAREGIAHSGSYLFADHLYRNQPSGRGACGRWLDRLLLNLPATAAMRSRCGRATAEMERAFRDHLARSDTPFRILTMPCGLPRDFRDFVGCLAPEERRRIVYTGMDLDVNVLRAAETFLSDGEVPANSFVETNALAPEGFGVSAFDFISSTGLGEFLDDPDLTQFYTNVRHALASGGTFFTSATAREQRSDWLLQTFELDTRYRDEPPLRRVLEAAGWKDFSFSHHASGLQTFVRGRTAGSSRIH